MQPLVDSLLQLDAADQQAAFLRANVAFSAEIAAQLKSHADGALRSSIEQATRCADLLHLLANIAHTPTFTALARRVEGNIAIFGGGDYELAVAKFEDAAAIYAGEREELAWASSQIGTVACLSYLGRSAEALTLAAQVRSILEKHADWDALFRLVTNLSVLHNRQGEVRAAVALLDEAQQLASQHELPVNYRAAVELNQARMLLNLGELGDAEKATQRAEASFNTINHTISAARAQEVRALVYLNQHRYNESLTLFATARAAYLADDRAEDALWSDLWAMPALLELGQYERVLALSDEIEIEFRERNVPHELATVLRHAAIAHAGQQQFDAAHDAMLRARMQCQQSGDKVQEAICQLEQATLFLRQRDAHSALSLAQLSGDIFRDNDHTLRVAQAEMVRAQAFAQLGEWNQTEEILVEIEPIAKSQRALWLLHQIYVLRGRMTRSLTEYERALEMLEQLRGRLITEFRADFLHDKQQIYEEAVAVALRVDDTEKALEWVERAKSRALVEMIGQRVDLRIQPRSAADAQRIAELEKLQLRRNVLYRQWSHGEDADNTATRQQLQKLEAEITDRWHNLLVRNGDYAREASLTRVRSEPVQQHLATATLLIDCFTLGEDILFFLVSRSEIDVVRVPRGVRKVAQLMRLFNLNVKATSTAPPERVPPLEKSARQLLQRLYQLLIRPIESQIAPYQHLLIAPHNAALHYLPFQALFDGAQYLGQRFAVSYLPSAALLAYQTDRPKSDAGAIAFGYSNAQFLPHATEEAKRIAELFAGRAFTEEAATIEQVMRCAGSAELLHFSTHGDFNQANPLFSGLALANGQLSTLDIFNLRLNASLVTLSACQTGRSVVKGGDELMGLMRAFLYAGADSLLLGLWQVNDRATLCWMETFYHALQAGQTKAQALQTTYTTFIEAPNLPAHYRHPYFWSPFFLVGKTDAL